MERPGIYSECFSSLIVTRDLFPLVGMFPHIISHRFSSGLVKKEFIWDNPPSLLGDDRLIVFYCFSSFLYDRT